MPVPAMKNASFCTEIDGFGHPFILPRKSQESPQEAPKRLQEPPKGLRPLKKGNPGAGRKGFPDLQINKGLYGP